MASNHDLPAREPGGEDEDGPAFGPACPWCDAADVDPVGAGVWQCYVCGGYFDEDESEARGRTRPRRDRPDD
jgi:hypothetical protein